MLGEMLGDGLAQPLERLPPGALEGQRLSGTIASTKSDHEPRRRQPDRLAPEAVVRAGAAVASASRPLRASAATVARRSFFRECESTPAIAFVQERHSLWLAPMSRH